MPSEPRVSIVLCTRDRADWLADCLRTILADRSSVARELVVVDNGSIDETAEVVRGAARHAAVPVRYVLEREPGQTPARNAGVRAARGELLVFTDDDVAVDHGWADAIAAAFDDPEVVAVAGRIVASWPSDPPAWLDGPHATMLTMIDFGGEPRLLAPGEFPSGPNFAVRAALLRRFDPPFHPRLGHVGRCRVGQDEYFLVNRLRPYGKVAYQPAAVVSIRIEPQRLDLAWMRSAFFQLGIGLGRRGRLEGFPFPSTPRRVVRAARLLRAARSTTRRNANRQRDGAETWNELSTYMWAGLHVEMLVGRSHRLSNWVVRSIA